MDSKFIMNASSLSIANLMDLVATLNNVSIISISFSVDISSFSLFFGCNRKYLIENIYLVIKILLTK